jgi:hypothetical protein
MSYRCFAVLASEKRRGRRPANEVEQPAGFHATEAAAAAARERWEKRQPHRRWRVRALAEGQGA